MNRNPDWTRDEYILALDVYLRHNPMKLVECHPEVIELSRLLKELPLHEERPLEEVFRNTTGIYFHLRGFMKYDPNYLEDHAKFSSKLAEKVWNDFCGDFSYLHKVAEAIRKCYSSCDYANIIDIEEEEFFEGRILYQLHRLKETDHVVVRKLRTRTKKSNNYKCAVCGFDFNQQYGELGKGYIEFHHVLPVTEYVSFGITKTTDFVQVCSNCHKMLHRKRPWLVKENVQELVKGCPEGDIWKGRNTL